MLRGCADRIGRLGFSVPIARTLENTLSANTLRRLVRAFGESRTASMLITARKVDAQEALASWSLTAVAEDLDGEAEALIERVVSGAPLTQWAIKENLRRLAAGGPVDDADVVSKVYGSQDFAHAVECFLTKTPVDWEGE